MANSYREFSNQVRSRQRRRAQRRVLSMALLAVMESAKTRQPVLVDYGDLPV